MVQNAIACSEPPLWRASVHRRGAVYAISQRYRRRIITIELIEYWNYLDQH